MPDASRESTTDLSAVQNGSVANKLLMPLLFLLIGGGAATGGITFMGGQYDRDKPMLDRMVNQEFPELKGEVRLIRETQIRQEETLKRIEIEVKKP